MWEEQKKVNTQTEKRFIIFRPICTGRYILAPIKITTSAPFSCHKSVQRSVLGSCPRVWWAAYWLSVPCQTPPISSLNWGGSWSRGKHVARLSGFTDFTIYYYNNISSFFSVPEYENCLSCCTDYYPSQRIPVLGPLAHHLFIPMYPLYRLS